MEGSSISKSGGKCTIDVRSEDDTVFVKCKGRLVYGQTDILKEGVRDLLRQSKRVVIDLGDVDYMDSAGLGTVLYLYASAKTSHCELQLVNLAPRVRQLFGITNILSLFEPCGEHNIRMP
ncbi:MAG: STAS domain-containing protein [Terriglobia bacterium]|jgi:anti-sigma B factor antagonist